MKIPNIDDIWRDDPKLAEALSVIGAATDNIGQKLSINPQGGTVPPSPPTSISVTANASGIHRVSLTDTNPRTRNVEYFVEHSTDPNFVTNVQIEHLGVARQRSIPQSMGTTPVYYRAYAQYLDGTRSDIRYFGSATAPTAVIDNATTLGPPHHPTVGSGTAQVAGYGFGRETFVSPPTTPGKPPKIFGEPTPPTRVGGAASAPPPPPPLNDMLNVVRLDPSLRGNTFLTGPQGPIYTFVDAGNSLTWYIKDSTGFPWDGKPYDNNYAISDWITENVRTDPHTFKNWEMPIPLVPRFYNAGSGQWSFLTTGTPKFDVHTSCSVFTVHDLGPQVLGTFEGTFSRDFGGDIGVRPYYLCTYNYNWNGTTYTNSEHLFFVGADGPLLALGWVRWELWTNGVLVQFSDFNLIRSGTPPVLDFPCPLP